MATTFQFQQQQQQQQPHQKELSPEQDFEKRKEAQELFKRLQFLLMEGESPALDIISETLLKFEELSAQVQRQSNIDPDTRKTIEDISALLLAARQTAKNKGLAEKLQRIADASQKALRLHKPGLSSAPEVTQEFLEFMNTWRPLFYLLLSSKDFRVLILDSIKISRRVVYSFTDNLSDEPQQKFVEGESPKEVAHSLKEEVKEKGVPELTDEEWERIQDDLQRAFAILAKEPTYREGLERLFRLLDMFQTHLIQDKPLSPTGLVTQDTHIHRVVGETEELISSFSGKETLDDFKYHLSNLIRKTKEDRRFHSYLNELKDFILKSKSEQEIRTQEFKHRSKELARNGRELIREFKEDDLRPFLDSANMMINNIKNDDFLQILRHHAGIVQSDLSYVDTEGKIQLDMDMLSKLQRILVPFLVDVLKYIPLPRIISSDENREFVLDKIVFCSYDIIPENIKFHLESDSEFSLKDVEVKGTHTFLVIQLNQLRTELKDVEFYYKKKTFPEIEDKGRATFRIKGPGAKLTLTYTLEQGPGNTLPKITKGTVDFDISDMDIEFDTNTIHHNVLVPMLTKIFKPQIKLELEREVEKNLGGFLAKLGDLISNTIAQSNKPFLSGLEATKKAIKSSDLSQLYQKRREKLE